MFKSYCLLIYFTFLVYFKCASRLHVEQIRREIQNDFVACSHSQPSRGHQNRRFKREQHTYSEQFLLFRGHEPYTISNYDTEKWINKTRYQFTIELTLTAEGGQSTESLFGIFDRCQPDRHPAIEVRFELNDESEEQENRLTVRLQSSMSNEIHRLRFHKPLRLYRTERIQITFDGNSLRVYRNGALERLMFETFSIPLFSETESKCKIVRVFPNHFHGWIHSDYNMEFASVNEEDESEIGVPSCGVSVCDNPVVLKNYATNVERRKQKVLRYRVVVISENDGSNPTVTDEQIELQHRDLTDAFGRYNITWKLHIERINNSNVRHKMIVFGCDQESLNGNCDSDCRGLSFGNDECKNTLVCPVKSIKNGICNPECNTEQNHWDGGDCCQEEENNRCFDPKSKYRRYLEAAEYKLLVNLDNMNMLTVYVANWTNDGLTGLSTFPFESEIYGVQGGILIHVSKFGTREHTHNLIHEIGHVLGLYHTHHGVDEMDCSNPCYEFEPSLLTGDLLEDTLPTSKQTSCTDVCQATINPFNDPAHNYMSYSGFGCVKEFSAQQAARMHCYVDLKYINKWSGNTAHSLPTNPWISIERFGRTSSLKLHWPKPIDRESCRPLNAQADDLHCSIDGRIVQYAYKARANNSFEFGGRWNAEQATGGPDAELCSPSTKAWLPDVEFCDEKDSCVLELWPDIKTTVEFLYVWIAWNAVDGIRSIDIDLTNGSTIGIKNIHAQCDSPFSRRLDIDTPIEKIRIRTDNPFVSVDAVKFVSHQNDPNCAHCIRFHYELERQPPFKNNKLQYTNKNTFIDWQVSSTIDQKYNYTVHLVGNDGTRYHSIQTVYEATEERCGDGVLNEETEECDDGNTNEFDGCSQFCRLDLDYLCNGTLCSRIDALDTNNSFVLVKATDYRLVSDGEFVCQLNEMSRPTATAQCESYDQLSDCYEMTTKMNSTIEAEFEPIHPKSLFVAFAPLSSKHQNNDSIDLELTTANNVKFKVNGLFVQSCTQSPLVIPIPKMNDNHDFISRLRLSVPTNYYIVTIGLLVDSVYYSKAVQQCLQIGNPSISTTKSKCIYSTPTPSTSLNCRPIPLNEYIDANCFNDICQIKCKSGLQMSNGMKFEMRCTPNGWMGLKMFDLVSHFCIPVDCGKPLTIPSMNVNCLNGYNLGAECEVKCQPNALSYPLYRQSSSIECLKSGVWSAPELICIDACSVDEFDNWNVNRTSLICHSELNHLFGQSNSGYWPMGSECSGRCKLGYHLETNQSHDTLLRCSNASNWSGPKCVRKHCPLTSTYHQALDCTDGANVGSECRFNCSTEMGPRIRSIFCLPNARWSQRFACPLKPKGYCEIPTMPTNLVVKCPKYVAFGTNCSIECRSKGYDVVVETHRPQFKFQQITNLTCKSNGLLVARFANLKCLRSCNEEFFGDDWCDFQNNRQYCHFDGGDCCNSTVSTRRVRVMFQMLCTSHLCQCIDPMAVENRGLRLFDPNEGLWFGRRLRSTRHIDANNHDVSYANPSLQIVRSVELIALQSSRTNNHFGLLTRLHENWRQRRPKVEMHENNFMTND